MITIEDLKKLRAYDQVILAAKERLADIRFQAQNLTPIINGMPGGGTHYDKMAAFVVKLEQKEEELGRTLVALLALENKVRNEILILPEQQLLIMNARYLMIDKRTGRRLSWKAVARKTHYSVQHCKYIHEAAVRNLCGDRSDENYRTKGLTYPIK